MHPEAVYWALLSDHPLEDDAAIAGLLAAWHAKGKRSVHDLFEQDPGSLAEILGIPESALAPMVRLRPRLPQAHRLIDRLVRDGVELVTIWERRYPQQLRSLLGEAVPMVLWHLGPLKLLDGDPVAILGSRDVPQEALSFARQVGGGVARAGRPVLTGVARAVERAALEAALRVEGGTAVALLAQGIARAMPELRHWQGAIRGNRLLVAGVLHPEAAWQPWHESLRGVIGVGLAERVVVAHAGSDDDAWETARQALQLGRQVYIRDGVSDELERSGAIAVPPGEMAAATVLGVQPMLSMTPAESGHLDAAANDVEGDVAANRHVADRESTPTIAALPAGQEDILDMPLPAASEQPDEQTPTIVVPEFTLLPPPPSRGNRAAATAARRRPSPEAERPPAGLPPGVTLEEALLTCLTTAGGKVVGKGALLRTTGVEEASLDRALLSLIAARRIVQRTMRAGVGYVLADSESPETGVSTFQPSLFNQE